jgi:AspBHI-like restriction endonuclease
MKAIPLESLSGADLIVDAVYQGGRKGNAGDDPLPKLMRVDSQGGFRYRGKIKGKLELLVLTTSMNDPDWPDALDPETGIFTYFGDNKKPGRDLHEIRALPCGWSKKRVESCVIESPPACWILPSQISTSRCET